MKWFKFLATLALAGAVLLGALVYWLRPVVAKVESTQIAEGIQVKFKTNGADGKIFESGVDALFCQGSEYGGSEAGHIPWRDWPIPQEGLLTEMVEMIHEMGAKVIIRVYTIKARIL